MKSGTHPELNKVVAHCTGCENEFETISVSKEIRVSLCSQCHPFYTGEQRFVDTAGRVEKFQQKYAKIAQKAAKKKSAK